MSRRLDVVVWGASGYTGGFIAEYLARNYSPAQDKKVKWAIAGRNLSKLDEVKARIVKVDPSCKDIEILIADLSSQKELDQLVSQTKVILSAAGPFTQFGTPIVDSCVRMGTHYCDITGEVNWAKKIIDKYDHTAKEKNVILVPFCGFDSIPSDMGTFMIVDHVKQKYNDTVKNVTVYFSDYLEAGSKAGSGMAGGTPRSALAVFDEKFDRKMYSPNYLINPGHPQFVQHQSNYAFWRYQKAFKVYSALHTMSFVNEKIVFRSASILKYGSQFSYNEYLGTKSLLKSAFLSLVFMILSIILVIPFVRTMIYKLLPEPGKGPSPDRLKFSFGAKIRAVTSKGRVVNGSIVAEGDPGYRETSKMVSESAICLALHSEEIIASVHGGVHTPASSMGRHLLERLRNAKMEFKVDQ